MSVVGIRGPCPHTGKFGAVRRCGVVGDAVVHAAPSLSSSRVVTFPYWPAARVGKKPLVQPARVSPTFQPRARRHVLLHPCRPRRVLVLGQQPVHVVLVQLYQRMVRLHQHRAHAEPLLLPVRLVIDRRLYEVDRAGMLCRRPRPLHPQIVGIPLQRAPHPKIAHRHRHAVHITAPNHLPRSRLQDHHVMIEPVQRVHDPRLAHRAHLDHRAVASALAGPRPPFRLRLVQPLHDHSVPVPVSKDHRVLYGRWRYQRRRKERRVSQRLAPARRPEIRVHENRRR